MRVRSCFLTKEKQRLPAINKSQPQAGAGLGICVKFKLSQEHRMRAETMLEKYLHMFGKLRTEEGRDRYPEITCHRAPHKPFLLLSIIDLIAQGRITENLIEPSCRILGDSPKIVNFVIGQGLSNQRR